METRERVISLDPADKAVPAAGLQMLIFDRLVRFDDTGRLQPGLAVSWQPDNDRKRWEFRLRPGVKFHDGYPLNAAAVAGALQRLLAGTATVAASADSIVIQSDHAIANLPAELARPAASIAARGPDGALVGTGPFRVSRFDPARHLSLAAFEEHWAGRPFLDAVEIEMGRSPRDQFVDLQLGRADLVELSPSEMRPAMERGTRTWNSAPVEVLALAFGQGHAPEDPRLREALALAIDRAAIHNVLLQRQGVANGALLPQWLSGYAFLFANQMDLVRARQVVAELAPADRSLPLAYDPSDAQARIIAERIAVNARDAGLSLQVTNLPRTELRLVRVRFTSLDPVAALAEVAAGLGLPETRAIGSGRPELVYNAERSLLEGYRAIPLFDLPETYAAGPRVRMWLEPGISRMGWLQLADVWVEAAP
jgi:ABC-type transport system substrate-binding protein